MRLPDADLTLIRDTQSHYTDLYLSIFQPTTVMTALVNNASAARGDRVIPYDGASGDWGDVKIGSTLLVGSTAGARDKGKIRIKDIDASNITVSENSHIKWANNLYLTVLNYFDVWPIFPRIIQDPADSEQVIFYKDYDIVYSNQNAVLGAYMNIGPNRAAFLENGSKQVYYSASGTYAHSGAVSDVQWSFEGGTPSTYHGLNPGYVSYDTAGHYLTQCTVSGTNGWVENAYRFVSIYDKFEDGPNNPVRDWTMSDPQGSRAEAGYTTSITVYENVEIQEGSVVVLFADEWYGGTRKSLGGNALNASDIKLVGYVMDGSVRYDYKASSVTFDVGSLTQVLKEMEGFAIELQSKASPSKWYEMADVNAKKAIYHYFKWHSNVIELADIEFVGDDYLVQYFDSDRESLFDAVDNFLRSAYHGSAVSDRQGKIWLEIDSWIVPDATGTFSPIFDMSKYDWIGEPNVKERRYPELSYLEYNGIAYSGVSTGTFKPLEACAPGSTPGYRGSSNRLPGFALSGQSQLNQLVGNDFEYHNTQYPSIDFAMRGNWSNLDIAPQEAIQVDIAAEDTVRNQAISGLYMPSSITWQSNFKNKSFTPRVTFTPITSGDAGETIVIPEIVDDGGYGGSTSSGFSIPTIAPSVPVINSYYSALKLETNGGVNKALPQNVLVESPLTQIVFSTEGLPAGTASGTWSGLGSAIIPTVGASGTYGINYGFVVTYPGTYRVSYYVNIENVTPGAGTATMESKIKSNTDFPGLIADYTNREAFDITEPTGFTLHNDTILHLPANGFVTIQVINYSTHTGFRLDRSRASVEFMYYG